MGNLEQKIKQWNKTDKFCIYIYCYLKNRNSNFDLRDLKFKQGRIKSFSKRKGTD